ncbi:MAG: NUDIX domain-containing protein, partial [Pirellulaceae bacterium]|nr:NUDIX domain-containing protein [Pirellulaceae bacterium]
LVYFTDGSETWTLLGYDHHYKVWCAFGGGKKGDKHSSDIALRELKEETRYVYGERIPVELENPFEEKEYHTYLASVPFQPVPVLLRASPERTSKDDNEMSAYIWIPLDELVAAVENCPDKEKFDGIDLPEKFMPLAWRKGRAKPNRKLRSAFARTLDKLKAEGRLADLLHR